MLESVFAPPFRPRLLEHIPFYLRTSTEYGPPSTDVAQTTDTKIGSTTPIRPANYRLTLCKLARAVARSRKRSDMMLVSRTVPFFDCMRLLVVRILNKRNKRDVSYARVSMKKASEGYKRVPLRNDATWTKMYCIKMQKAAGVLHS